MFLHVRFCCFRLHPPSAVFCVRLSRRSLEQRHAPRTSRCESEHLQAFTCDAHSPSLWHRNMFLHLQLLLVLHVTSPFIRCPSILASSSFLRHKTATIISRLHRSHLALAVFLRIVFSCVYRRRRHGSTFKQQLHAKRIASARTSVLWVATPGAQVSGERFFSL